MDWVPVVFITFKALIFVTCMFFAIKWHYDQGKKKGMDSRALIRSGAMVAGGFFVGLAVILYLTFTLASSLGLDLSY